MPPIDMTNEFNLNGLARSSNSNSSYGTARSNSLNSFRTARSNSGRSNNSDTFTGHEATLNLGTLNFSGWNQPRQSRLPTMNDLKRIKGTTQEKRVKQLFKLLKNVPKPHMDGLLTAINNENLQLQRNMGLASGEIAMYEKIISAKSFNNFIRELSPENFYQDPGTGQIYVSQRQNKPLKKFKKYRPRNYKKYPVLNFNEIAARKKQNTPQGSLTNEIKFINNHFGGTAKYPNIKAWV